ncbi:MAG TPA: hypothetical protein VJG90_01035 [Candidatus Nanoarchaeia archaeon]|nr:hypothetical protein [Candidatus Nanoarchaeia archaeon]
MKDAKISELAAPELEVPVNVEQQEKVEIVLFDYEDDECAFTLSFEFVYTYNHKLQQGFVEIR